MSTQIHEADQRRETSVSTVKRRTAALDGHLRLSGRSSAGEIVQAYLEIHAAKLKAFDPLVRRDEPDAIHQMRVTVRRLRAALQAFSTVVPREATTHLRDELKWLGQVLGDARDAEVLDEHLHCGLASMPMEFVLGPAQATLTSYFAPRQAAARSAVLDALDSSRYRGLLAEVDRLLDSPPDGPAAAWPAAEVLPGAVARAYRRTRRRMRRAWQAPAGPARDVALHAARKAAKRARYAAEAAKPAFGKQAGRFANGMKGVQSVLGDHQDAVTARAACREIGIHAYRAGENAFSFGLLAGRADRDTLEFQRQAKPAWKHASRRKARRWLG
jgi:CHAD domain-containing protein